MKFIHVQLSPPLKERLEERCKRLGLSMSAFVRLAVVEKLERE
ncbi:MULTISPECIES: ribbon-helix-helix domain-containing protein [Streptococcus]|uniref:Ribbon-helix-helix protein CopG domain-containing protein n=1 Tax=Streptococcus himalayensis TaxID=1888195 RepID=A0A917A4P0_9STRE|nr:MULTISPECIES: ribbon-helix-helix domain-containing protein [Streptococcus]QBX25399.1 hypothetical protein Javan254_0044 [Streptococcus phage Javan254]QBX25402.1 hypothetical protein Javan254_0047 [Streptococcus phage Javan254]GGE26535.1 hypothetical protein GCM10011510_04680 [Streptococcus himalayensis]